MDMNKNKIFIGFVLCVGIIIGLIGAALFHYQKELIAKVLSKIEYYRVAHIPAKTEVLVISDFENPADIGYWKSNNADVQPAAQHVISGKNSLQVIFHPSEEASGITLKRPFLKNKALRNWEGYEGLGLDIYNPQDQALTAKIKIKDARDRGHTEDIYLRPKANNQIFVGIPRLRGEIAPGQIEQMNIFLWNSKNENTLYIDNIRLIPQKNFNSGALVILDASYLPKPGERIYKAGNMDFGSRKSKWLVEGAIHIPLYVNNPSSGTRTGFPVSGGIPFPKGELKSAEGIRVLDHNHMNIPSQFRVLGRWADQSIKWLQIDTKLDLTANQRQLADLQYPAMRQVADDVPGVSGMVNDLQDRIVVNTGPLKFFIDKKSFHTPEGVWLDQNNDGQFDNDELISGASELVLVHKKEEYRGSLDKNYTLTIEENGPLKVTIKAEGWFTSKKNKKFCKFIVRFQAFAGESFIRVYHTFIYTGYPQNQYHYLYKGKRLPANDTIEAIYLETPINLKGPWQYALAGTDSAPLTRPSAFAASLARGGPVLDDLRISQNSSESFVIQENGVETLKGQRLQGWLDLGTAQGGMTVLIKNFWQQFPKGWQTSAKERKLRTYLWPPWQGDLDLQTTAAAYGDDAVARGSAFGLGKTHEMALYFHAGPFDSSRQTGTIELLSQALLLSASPSWVEDTAAIGEVKAYDPRLKIAEETAERMFDWAQRQIKDFKWYGMLDFGDTRSIYADGGWRRDGRHGWMNNEAMGPHSGAFAQYLRTGQYKYFEFAENSARHIMDVDTVHYNTIANDPRLSRVIFDDYSQVGSQHRHNADHWGGRNEETSHTNLHGILLYYYMTGYERAFDVAKEIGEFFLKERMTYFRHPDICPQRNIANVLWGAVEMFEATGDIRYKKLADKWANVLYEGQRHDGTWLENYNPITRQWEGKEEDGYTLDYTFPALIAYHRLTGNKAIAGAIVETTKFYMDHKPYNPFFEALLYSYYLTGEREFLSTASERLEYYASSQRRNDNPLENGMIYQKAYYARPMEFLYQFPYVFEALEEREKRAR